MENIRNLANENIPYLIDKYNSFLDEYEFSEHIEKFTKHLNANLSVSINFRLSALFHFLQEGNYKNIYEIFSHDYDQMEKNNPLFSYRFSFDSSFDNGTDFKYGALNSGNIGTKFWGDFCIHLESKEINSSVLIKYNSLSKEPNGKYRYFTKEKELLLDKLKNDLSNFENAIPLVVLKNKDQDYSKLSVNEYNGLVNDCDLEYMETIIDVKLTLAMVSKIAIENEVFIKMVDSNVATKENKSGNISLVRVLKEITNKNITLEYL